MPSADGHAADMETLLTLYGLVRYLRPALIVEAGTYMGHATCAMASALRDGEIDGEVWTADIRDYGAAANAETNGLTGWTHFYNGDFSAMLDGPLAGRNFRFAFIDSGLVVGTAEGIPERLRVGHVVHAHTRLTKNGVMAVDDCASEWNGVSEIRALGSLFLPNGRGMVIVQRP